MAIKLICRKDQINLTKLFPKARVAGPLPGPVFGITAVLDRPVGSPLAVHPVLIVCPQCGTSNVFDSNALPPTPPRGGRLATRFKDDGTPDYPQETDRPDS